MLTTNNRSIVPLGITHSFILYYSFCRCLEITFMFITTEITIVLKCAARS